MKQQIKEKEKVIQTYQKKDLVDQRTGAGIRAAKQKNQNDIVQIRKDTRKKISDEKKTILKEVKNATLQAQYD